MFLFGILSSPLPYLLIAIFYFFGFATGMFSGSADSETSEQIQVKNIQVEPQEKTFETAESTFKYHDYYHQKKITDSTVLSMWPSAFSQKEKLIYLVHNIKVHHSPTSETIFCRPPPSCS
ncbi:MAG: hypothetical protein A2066_08830 [Bacteroidetes bacterium GWB2_41_8]|nr:MAG: hypothetical protein A2066_08830 [Bacteroidetes bacterium GWB2_41_8]